MNVLINRTLFLNNNKSKNIFYLSAYPPFPLLVPDDVVGVDVVGALHVLRGGQLHPRLVVRLDVGIPARKGM